jgi:hypothetical protein
VITTTLNQGQTTPRNRQELEALIIKKAQQDTGFKQELLNNPTSTIMKELGLEYTPDVARFKVLEETPDTLYLVLPMEQQQIASLVEQGKELTDDELERFIQIQPVAKCSPSRRWCTATIQC